MGFSAFTGDLTLNGLAITGGQGGYNQDGGGILFASDGMLTLNASAIADNRAGDGFDRDGGDGGGIYAGRGSVTLIDSLVTGNSAGDGGYGFNGGFGYNGGDVGGIFAGSVTLTNSTVSGNSAGNGGNVIPPPPGYGGEYGEYSGDIGDGGDGGDVGGIFAGSVMLTNSTVSRNSAGDGGYAFGPFFGGGGDNGNAGDIGGISTTGGVVTINNSIVAGNFSGNGAPDILVGSPSVLTVNHSLFGSTNGSGITATTGTGNILNQSPMHGPLADNGGPTLTHALLPGSPAIDAGSNALALDENGNLLTTDQRGEARGTRLGTVDIGAFELESDDNFEVRSLVVGTSEDVVDRFDEATSLREAIAFANDPTAGVNNDGDADGDGFVADTITFDASVFTGEDNSVIRLTQGQLLISATASIDGTSVGGVVITGDANGDDVTTGGSHITDVAASFGGVAGASSDLLDDNSRVLDFSDSNGDLSLTGLTITGGRTTGTSEDGAGVLFRSSGTLTLNDSTVSGNSTTGDRSFGGGIRTSSGDVTLVNSTVSGNSNTGDFTQGGGIFTFTGSVILA